MNSPISGLAYFMEGFRLIFKPNLKRFVFIPLMINVILFMLMFFVAWHFISQFNHWFLNFLPSWLHWLNVIVWLLFFASFFLIITYTFVTLANLVCAPFNSFLAEKIELFLVGAVAEPRTLSENIKDIPRIMGRQLAILGYYLPRALLLFILLFVPVIQVFAAIFWFLFHAWFITITYLDYPTDNHRIPIQAVRVWMNERRWVSLGFGISVLIATMIPILNLLTIPAAVAAATKMWVDEQQRFKSE